MHTKTLIAMSGGVDSAVAAYLMLQKGGVCAGVTMRLHDTADANGLACGGELEIRDAAAVAARLGLVHHVADYRREFEETVIRNFIEAYESGATPNPCVVCNRHIKFEALHTYADRMGYDCLATGHYARIERSGERYLLKKAADPTKDQSYVLYALTQKQLARTLFPLGEMTKNEVRGIARENGFENAHKKDSQDICFVPDGDYVRFIESYTGKTYPCGDFIDESGRVLGRHQGIIRYTVGQRKGLGIALGRPMFVSAKDPQSNTVTLSDNQSLFGNRLLAGDLNLIPFDALSAPLRVQAKVRYGQEAQWATVEQIGLDRIHVEFDTPQRAIARGQSIVLYDGEYVVGGAIIE